MKADNNLCNLCLKQNHGYNCFVEYFAESDTEILSALEKKLQVPPQPIFKCLAQRAIGKDEEKVVVPTVAFVYLESLDYSKC